MRCSFSGSVDVWMYCLQVLLLRRDTDGREPKHKLFINKNTYNGFS